MNDIKNKVTTIIYMSIDEINRQSSSDKQLSKRATTILLGDNGKLDSLGLINLIVSVEEKLLTELGVQVMLLDEDALVDPDGPYSTVESFSEWIITRIV